MKYIIILCSIALIVGCSKSENKFNFLGCQLSIVEYTGEYTETDNFTYDNSGYRTKLVINRTGSSPYTETYQYDNTNKVIKIVTSYDNRELVYSSGKLSQIITRDFSNNLISTEDRTEAGSVITFTRKNQSSVVIFTDEYTMNGQDVVKEVYREYNGPSIAFEEILTFSNFDTKYNPELLYSVIYPSSIHNYNLCEVKDTDNSGANPVVTTFNLTYVVTANKSNAVSYRVRTRSDNNAVLYRTYTYNKCQ
jgi:major membrane immunogen (membrane-anchored lipoprotein)